MENFKYLKQLISIKLQLDGGQNVGYDFERAGDHP